MGCQGFRSGAVQCRGATHRSFICHGLRGCGVRSSGSGSLCKIPYQAEAVRCTILQHEGKIQKRFLPSQRVWCWQAEGLRNYTRDVDPVVQYHPTQCQREDYVPFPEEGALGKSSDVAAGLLRFLLTEQGPPRTCANQFQVAQ